MNYTGAEIYAYQWNTELLKKGLYEDENFTNASILLLLWLFFLPEMMPSEADFAPARVTQLRGRSRRKRICLVMRGLSSGMSIISPLL